MDIQTIHAEAMAAANQAQQILLAQRGDTLYCGFAWVNVYVDRTNSREAKELLKIGFRKDYRPKCLCFWKPGSYGGQSMDVHEEGARAYAEVLSKYGFRAYAGSRPD
jgi:hypothetical protein